MKIEMKYGAKMVINTNDHNPPHVHCIKGSWSAKIALDGTILSVRGWDLSSVNSFVRVVLENKDLLEDKWNEIQKYKK